MKKRLLFLLARVRYFLSKRNNEIMNNYYRKCGVKIGKRCLICSNVATTESFCVEIGDDVVISTNVTLLTHDFSISKLLPEGSNLYGKIVIGNNCFIGARSVIMYGVELADNIIVAAGSVVTKSFDRSNVIIGGNPAKVIGTWDAFREKNRGKCVKASEIRKLMETQPEVLVRRKVSE